MGPKGETGEELVDVTAGNDPLRLFLHLKGPILLQMKDTEQKRVCFQLVSGQFCCFSGALLGGCAAHRLSEHI